MSPNLYQVLEVPNSATLTEIKISYKKKALLYHPDKHPGISDSLIKCVNEAYRVLSNPTLRAEYDDRLKNGFPELKTWCGSKETPEAWVQKCKRRETELKANYNKRTFQEQEEIDTLSRKKRRESALRYSAQRKLERTAWLKLEKWKRKHGREFSSDDEFIEHEYCVEKILDKKEEDGISYYLIKWEGYDK